MNIPSVLLFITAAVNSLLSLFVLIGKRDRTNFVYSLFVIFASLWSVGLAFFIREPNVSKAVYIADFYYVAALGIPVFFYYFSLIFLNKGYKMTLKQSVIFLPLIFLTIAFFINKNLFLEKIFWADWGKDVVINHFNYILYAIFFVVFLTLAYVRLFRLYRTTSLSPEKHQLKLILWGTSIGYFFGMIFDLILPFLGDYQHIYIGPIFSLVMVGSIAYAIGKYQMFNIKVAVTELLIIILCVFILIRATLSQTTTDQISNVILLVASIIVGIFIIKSVNREIEQREHIEKLAKDLERANEKLKELDHLKSEFLSLATHQIRAPLTAIKGYSSMLLEGDFGELPRKAQDSVNTIFKSCQNLINIVEDFLNISRIEQGRLVYQKSVFDMRALVKEVLNELKPNIDKAGLNLEIKMPLEEAAVNADRNKIKQIVSNIVDNAIKYTIRGYIYVSVTAKEKVRLEVKDTGVGIDPAEINKLFVKFSRTKDANRTNVLGTGLGLYIAKKMAEAHGGDVKVFSEGLGHGSTFTLELPEYKN